MKTTQQILTIINNKTVHHKNELNKVVDSLKGLKKTAPKDMSDEDKQKLVAHTMVVIEHKSALNTLVALAEEIAK